MKRIIYFTCLSVILLFFNLEAKDGNFKLLQSSGKFIPNIVEGVKYEPGNWEHPDYSKPFKSRGNHRFVIKTETAESVVCARIPWRRGDENPAEKGVIIINAKTGQSIKNILIKEINNEFGAFLFEPESNSDIYYVYYLPHESTGGYYPKVKYLPQNNTADNFWISKTGRLSSVQIKDLPEAKIISAQFIDDFHNFFPMEIIATEKEVSDFFRSNPGKFYLFPEYRENPIKMEKFLPLHWVKRGLKNGISDTVKKGEFYTFQTGVYSGRKKLSDIKVFFSGLRSDNGDFIPKTGIECFNTSGIGLDGKFFEKKVDVDVNKVQPLWFGINIPENIKEGEYRGTISIEPRGIDAETIHIELNILPETIKNRGENKPENMSRLRWLNSRLGRDKNYIVKPFTPVVIKGNALKILGRKIVLDRNGLPGEILSFFSEKMTYLRSGPEPVLAKPVSLNVIRKGNKREKWISGPLKVEQKYGSEASWSVQNNSDNFILKINGSLEYDGMLNYKMELSAKKDVDVSDIILKVPMDQDASLYMVGLGKKGGKRQESISWKWEKKFHHEGVWLGNINKGLQYVLRDENYERPLNTNFYHNKPLNLPPSWYNDGKGGIRISKKRGEVVAENYSGERRINKGDKLHFNVRFLITPFKTINIKEHFKTRFVHKYVPVDSVVKWGGSVVNVHHANEINPYINYPFFNLDKQKAYIDEAHSKGIKVKLYNTIRELTYRAYELFALKSLGDEILNDGKGGGHSWLQEHLRANYHSAWHATSVNDAAILNKGTSRWTNYYIEGLNWLAKNQKIDGLYLDDIAFSRETVKRITTVLNKHRDEVIIDLHSANQFNNRDGFINSVFLYMEHLPYISRLWFGEYFEYDLGPDYWLTEVSGIPFGLTGEMLEKGGHPFRGMVYGMTTRVYGKYNPGELWKLFDEFDIAGSDMLGYWVKNSPVKTSHENIRSTIYRHSDRILIALGSWSEKNEKIFLDINWKELGFKKGSSTLIAPEIKGLQEYQKFDINNPVPVEKNKGIILILKEEK
ncbi:MAG: glycoside hydrolase domain-containing protein [Acidobacteriota bacterium]